MESKGLYSRDYSKYIMLKPKYKVIVKTIQDKFLVFKVDEYQQEGNFIVVKDKNTLQLKKFYSGNVEIQEI